MVKAGWIFPILGVAGVVTAGINKVHGRVLVGAWVVEGFSLLIWMLGLSVFWRWTLIETRRSSEASTFWRRKGDDVVVGLILGLVSFVLGFLTGKLT